MYLTPVIQGIGYSYDPAGRTSVVTYPSGGEVGYRYNSAGQVDRVTWTKDGNSIIFADNIEYKPFGNIKSLIFGNGLGLSYLYDSAYRFTDLNVGSILNLTNAQYDTQGNLTQRTDDGVLTTWGYDTLSRLDLAGGSFGVFDYDYDLNGNRRQVIYDGQTTSYSYETSSNRIDFATDWSYTLDANGNTVKKVSADSTGFYYSYDTHNQLAQVDEHSIANGALLRGLYGYNGLGQRVSKDNGSKITHYIYGLDGALIAETNDTGTPLREYVYLNGEPLAAWYSDVSGAVQTEALYYYHNDHLGTPQAMTDSSGTKVWEADYQPFGKASITLSNIENNLRFPGQYYDAETGLHYNYYRYYDPETGRYITSDPIGLRGGLNTYGYVSNNPISFIDPLGLYTEIIIWQPVGHTSSSFGHVSSNVNGTNYSWGPGGWDTKYPNASDYANRQKTFRSGVGQILNLTPEQEKKLVACYAKHGGDYGAFSNNCGDPHKDCLKEALGTSVSDSFFPVNIGNDLLDSPYNGGSTFYPGPERGFWDDGFWAR